MILGNIAKRNGQKRLRPGCANPPSGRYLGNMCEHEYGLTPSRVLYYSNRLNLETSKETAVVDSRAALVLKVMERSYSTMDAC